jgi:hypothetical protein
VRIADESPAQGEQIVHGVGCVFRHAQSPVAGEVKVHLGGRLRIGRHLKFDLEPVKGLDLAGLINLQGWRNQAALPGRRCLAEAGTDSAHGSASQRGTVHISGSAAHRGARVHVLGHCVLDEPDRSHDRDGSSLDLGQRRHTEHATEVISMAVAVEDGEYRPVAPVGTVKLQRGPCRLR